MRPCVGTSRYGRVVQGIASIDVVAGEVGSERAALLTHFDAVDTKSGVVLGFAGAIAALSARPIGPWSGAGLIAATASGILALVSFCPRKYWRTDLDP